MTKRVRRIHGDERTSIFTVAGILVVVTAIALLVVVVLGV